MIATSKLSLVLNYKVLVAEWSLLIPEESGSNLVIGFFFIKFPTFEKLKLKNQDIGILKYSLVIGFVFFSYSTYLQSLKKADVMLSHYCGQYWQNQTREGGGGVEMNICFFLWQKNNVR